MNNNFSFPGTPLYSGDNPVPNQSENVISDEQSYIENILRLNLGKQVNVHMAFPDSVSKDQVFSGILEQSGKDHIILSNPQSGRWYLLLMIYVNYIESNEKIKSSKDFYLNN